MNARAMDGDVVLVAACGNVQAGDDAFGPLVTHRLREMGVEGMTVVDLDLRPAALLDHLPGPRALILVDAVVDATATPGELIDVDWSVAEAAALVHDDALSSHGLGLADQLRLAKTLGMLPTQVRLVGIPVESAAWGADRTAALAPAVEAAARRIVEHVARRRS